MKDNYFHHLFNRYIVVVVVVVFFFVCWIKKKKIYLKSFVNTEGLELGRFMFDVVVTWVILFVVAGEAALFVDESNKFEFD